MDGPGLARSEAYSCIESDGLRLRMILTCSDSPMGRALVSHFQANPLGEALLIGSLLDQVLECCVGAQVPVSRESIEDREFTKASLPCAASG